MNSKRSMRRIVFSLVLLLTIVAVLAIALVANTGIPEHFQTVFGLIMTFLGAITPLIVILFAIDQSGKDDDKHS